MTDERRERAGAVEEAVDPKAAQAETLYRCGCCGATRKGDWPDCCATAEAFNDPAHQAKAAGHAAAAASAAPRRARPREF